MEQRSVLVSSFVFDINLFGFFLVSYFVSWVSITVLSLMITYYLSISILFIHFNSLHILHSFSMNHEIICNILSKLLCYICFGNWMLKFMCSIVRLSLLTKYIDYYSTWDFLSILSHRVPHSGNLRLGQHKGWLHVTVISYISHALYEVFISPTLIR